MNFAEALEARRPLLGDAAVCTEIRRRGGVTVLPLWSARILFDNPALLEAIHGDHLAAGSDYVTANTFRTQGHVLDLQGHGERCESLTREACSRARRAVEASGRTAYVVGSMSPLEDCYRPDLTPGWSTLKREHRRHARALAAEGVDGILLETFSHPREIAVAHAEARATGLPVVISLCCNAEGRTIAGQTIREVVRHVEGSQGPPAAWAVNCLTPAEMTRAHRLLRAATARPTGAWAHVGHEDEIHGWCESGLMGPGDYAREARSWLDDGAGFVGGCCGTGAEFLRAIRAQMP